MKICMLNNFNAVPMGQNKCWAAQLIRKVFHLHVSFTFWFMDVRVLCYFS